MRSYGLVSQETFVMNVSTHMTMQKKKLGITVDPKEIDNKVATG